MKLNFDLVAREMSDWRPRFLCPRSTVLAFDRAEMFGPDSSPRPDTLFLIGAHAYRGLPSSWERAGCSFLVVGPLANARPGMPALAFERQGDVREAQRRLVALRERLEGWVERLTQAIVDEAPLQDIFDMAAEGFENPLMLSDGAFLFVLTAGRFPKDFHDRFWSPAMETKICPVERYSDTWRRASADARLRHRACLAEDRQTGRHYLYRFLASDSEMYGMVELVDVNTPFSNADIAILDHISDLLALAVRQGLRRESLEQESDPVRRLLFGLPTSDLALHAAFERRGWEETDGCYVCSVVNSVEAPEASSSARLSMTAETRLLYPPPSPDSAGKPGSPRYQIARHVERQVASRIPHSELFSYAEGCMLVVRERDFPLENLRKLIARKPFSEDDPIELLMGVSSVHASLHDLPAARDQAQRALRWAKEDCGGMLGTTRACFYDEAFVRDLADRLEIEKDARWLVPESVALLEAYDRSEHGEYRDTLLAYLENGCSANRTAKSLFIHRNTLAYRIKRIRDISGIDLENPGATDDLLRVWIACHALRRLSQSGRPKPSGPPESRPDQSHHATV